MDDILNQIYAIQIRMGTQFTVYTYSRFKYVCAIDVWTTTRLMICNPNIVNVNYQSNACGSFTPNSNALIKICHVGIVYLCWKKSVTCQDYGVTILKCGTDFLPNNVYYFLCIASSKSSIILPYFDGWHFKLNLWRN